MLRVRYVFRHHLMDVPVPSALRLSVTVHIDYMWHAICDGQYQRKTQSPITWYACIAGFSSTLSCQYAQAELEKNQTAPNHPILVQSAICPGYQVLPYVAHCMHLLIWLVLQKAAFGSSWRADGISVLTLGSCKVNLGDSLNCALMILL